MREVVTVFEGGRIDLPPGHRGQRARNLLLNIKVGGKNAFSLRNGALYAKDFVGAADVGDARVEVLPKPYGVSSVPQARQLLFDVLRRVGSEISFKWLQGGSASIDADLLDVVERRVSRDLLRRLEIGAPRRYEEAHERSSVLRGRILFSKYIRQLPSEAHVLPIQHSPLMADNSLGQLLKALGVRLLDRVRSYESRRDLDRCLDLLSSVKNCPLTPELVAKVHLRPMEAEWREFVDFAKLLALGKSSDPTSAGETSQATLLFPMNRLFEVAVRNALASTMGEPIECLRVPGEHCLLSSSSSDGSRDDALSIRPDLLFRRGELVVAAGDAKWKRLSDTPPRYSVLPADIYQLLAYMRHFGTPRGVLLYPRAEWMGANWQASFEVEPQKDEQITIVSVDLAQLMVSSDRARKAAAQALATRVQAALHDESSKALDSHAGLVRQAV